MARFDKLEFNEPKRDQPEAAPPVGNSPPVGNPRSLGKPPRPLETDWMAKADAQRRSGLYENALKYYSRALELDRSQVNGWLGQVQMLIFLEEYPEAELWGRKALELFPSHGDLLGSRAQAFCRLKDLKRAHEFSDGAFKQAGQSAYRWMVRGEILLAGRQPTEQYCFDKAQQLDADWLVSLEIALIYLYYHNPSKALLRARRAVESGPDRYYAWFIQGRCQEELGFREQSLQSYQHCLDICPGHTEARHRLCEVRDGGFSLFRWVRNLFHR